MVVENLATFNSFLLNGETKVMGIINVTPDSFSGDGLLSREDVQAAAIAQAREFLRSGAQILDVGGESTRPGADPVGLEEELSRIVPVLKALREEFPETILSVDTTKAEVARAAMEVGADIINDVSGLMMDPQMVDIALEYNVPVVLMHSQLATGISQVERAESVALSKRSIASEVAHDLERLAIHAISRGLTRNHIIVDPGIGFGKTLEQNLALINGLDRIKALGYPVLLGVSRKSFIGHTTGDEVEKRLPGSIAAATLGMMRGADIIRVHDVPETIQAVKLVGAMLKAAA